MELKIAIVEDKALLAEDLVDKLGGFGDFKILGPFSSGEEALSNAKTQLPDIALLDITLKGEMNGITLAERLKQLGPVKIIFLTQHEEDLFVNQALDLDAISFLNKPFSGSELKHAIRRAMKLIEDDSGEPIQQTFQDELEVLNDRIFVKNGRGKYFIKLDDIVWIQSGGGDRSTIMTKQKLENGNKYQPMVGHTLSRMESKLAFCPHLRRCNRFFIVNLKEVDRITDEVDSDYQNTGKKTLIVHNKEIKVGDKYRKDIMSKFHIL